MCIARVAILLKSVQLADILPFDFIGTLSSHVITTTTGYIPNMESFPPAAPYITFFCLSSTLSSPPASTISNPQLRLCPA